VIRCEIIVPKKYNDGTDVEPQHYEQTYKELVERFGGFTANDVKGGWMHLSKVYQEDNHVFKVDIGIDVARSELKFIKNQYKETLKARFKQHEIYIFTFPGKRL
jgi:hypothetical protein